MRAWWSVVPAVAVIAGCTSTESNRPEPDLSPWQPARVPADVDAAIAQRDYRLLDMMGIGEYTPGMDRAREWPTVNGRPVGTVCIGGSDVIPPDELSMALAMEEYAARYNQRMADYLAAHPRPPMPAATTTTTTRPALSD